MATDLRRRGPPSCRQALLSSGEPLGLPPDVPEGARALIRDCLRFNPELRPSAVEVVRRLRAAAAESELAPQATTAGGTGHAGITGTMPGRHDEEEDDTLPGSLA